MPETQTNNTSDTSQKPVMVKGPDSKIYKMPAGTTKEKAQAYFKSKGITTPVKKEASKPSTGFQQTGPDPSAVRSSMTPNVGGVVSDITRQGLEQAPNIGGIVGSIAGGGKGPAAAGGAALGGASGEALRQIGLRLLFNEGPTTSKDAAWKIVKEAAMQAGLQKGGEVAGEAFFKILSKIPHASKETMTVLGKKLEIPLLPGDVKGGITKYVEQFLTAYLPSTSVMHAFLDKQSSAIRGAADIIADGMSKFKGDPEQFGKLLQDSTNTARKVALQKIKTSGASSQVIQKKVDSLTAEFNAGLLGKIRDSRNVEQLSGALIAKNFGNEEIRDLVKYLSGADKHETFEMARATILGDVIKKTLTGKVDPIAIRQGQTFAGKEFTEILNGIGKGRLQTIYTPTQFKNLQRFESIISGVGGQGGFVGKFANLAFILGRGMSSVSGVTRLAGVSALTRVMAKVITSDTGIAAFESYIRATGQNAPRAVKMATDAIKVEIEKANREYDLEQKQLEQENK